MLPQGFWDSPHLSGNSLTRELRELSLEKRALLQYVDDLLISSETKQDSDQNTVKVLNFLSGRGYKVSPTKAQISQQRVQYLGFVLTPGARALAIDQKKQLVHYHLQPQRGNYEAFSGWLGPVLSGFQTMALLPYPYMRLQREKKGNPFNGIGTTSGPLRL